MPPSCDLDQDSCVNDRDYVCLPETQECSTDRDVGFFLVKLCIEAIVATNPAWRVPDFHHPELHTTTKSWPLFVDGIKCKRMTTVFNKNRTILVLDNISPNDVDISVADLPLTWRMMHFEKGKSFDIGSDCLLLLQPSGCKNKRLLKFIKHMAQVLEEDVKQQSDLWRAHKKSLNVDMYLIDMCLQQLLHRNPEIRRRMPAFATTAVSSVKTLTQVCVNHAGREVEEYTTIIQGKHMLCILDYVIPHRVTKKSVIDIHVKWNVLHCDPRKMSFRWAGFGTLARVEYRGKNQVCVL